MVHVALLIMVKNEEARLSATLDSVIGTVDSIVAYDTGSTDDTIGILKRFAKNNNIPLRLKEGEFVDFSTSRNVSLSFADTFSDIDFLLLLDCNDEIKGGEGLRKFCEEYKHNTDVTSYHVRQEWWTGITGSISFYTLRLLKPRTGWRYTGVVHEYIRNIKGLPTYSVKVDQSTVIYQDRTKDDNKSLKRFSKDKELLLKEHEINPKDTRTIFYLAQTYGCLHEHEDAFKYYYMRSKMEGFSEEVFFSLLRCGELLEKIKDRPWEDSMKFYIQALEHSKRVEPAMRIAEHYKGCGEWILAYTFADLACNMKYPKDCVLFVNRHKYEYERWHLLGIIAYYAGFYTRGKVACEIAIRNGHNTDLDKSNLRFYEDKLKEE